MSSLIALRTAIKNTLAADDRLDGVNISTHGGDFDLQELKAYAKRAPAIVVAIVKAQGENQGGLAYATATVFLGVLTIDRAGSPRDQKALQIVEALLNILQRSPNQYWGITDFDVSQPDGVQAENMYSRKLDEEGTAMWGVVFHQSVHLTYTEIADDFDILGVKYDLYPRDNDAPIGTPEDPQPDDAAIDAEDEINL
jgi:hypothetical protein